MAKRRLCACNCGEALPADARGNRRFLNDTHRERQRARRKRHRDKQAEEDLKLAEQAKYVELDESRARRGNYYRAFSELWAEDLAAGRLTQEQVAGFLDCSKDMVSRMLIAWRIDRTTKAEAESFEANDKALVDFDTFSRTYWPDYLVPDFHLQWSDKIDGTLSEGGKLMLLAPQRHGKSEMLIRYCLWRIMLNPNISILWVGKTMALAEKMVGYIRQILQSHEQLITDFAPDGTFQPPSRGGLAWTNGELTVRTRTEFKKTPTIVALGAGSTILGLDADLVIVDDPVDRAMMQSPSQRETVAEWFFTDLLSRKEEKTGLAYIGSRQHIDDLPARIMQQDGWEVMIYRAHDLECPHPEWDIEAHTDCVLWPEKRSFKYLMEQKEQNPEHFERNYLNNPQSDSYDGPTKDDLDRAWDANRSVGQRGKGVRLLASVDPGSGVKKHAIVIWAYDESGVREIVDVFEPNPGTPALVSAIKELHQKHNVFKWIFEKNRFEDQIRNDTGLSNLRSSLGLTFLTHYTGTNKQDPGAGVVAMLMKFKRDPSPIRLPGADVESRRRLAPFVRQCLTYDPEWAQNSKHAKDDLVMAAWVGWYWMDKHVGNGGKRMKVNQPKAWDNLTYASWNKAPSSWGAVA